MSEEVVAKRYARALFEIAAEQQTLEAFAQDLELIGDSLLGDKDISSFLTHPKVDVNVKKATLKKAFEGKVSPDVLSLLVLLVERGRENILRDVVKSYTAMANEARNVVNATVSTAFPLSAEETADLSAQFGKTIGKTVHMTNVVDPSIIGGLIVRIGDHLFDGSVKGKLLRFKQALVHS
ncbi:F0F1 ATP synthase subunit delta [Paenibacillus humicola]|uniref:F0F1 ATP synthase subunit delta n=1 Tax=Paenibacillus humicola TaxID=3110540 RepID=UPI00237C1CED|nr:F0F1 ATP synthase subunit delta [Paenibacillus humicola]